MVLWSQLGGVGHFVVGTTQKYHFFYAASKKGDQKRPKDGRLTSGVTDGGAKGNREEVRNKDTTHNIFV